MSRSLPPWSITAACAAILFWTGAGYAAERKLADRQPFSASVPADFTCRPDITVTVRAPDEAAFTSNRMELQKLIGGLRAILGFECPNTPITNLLVVGEAGGKEVYRGAASESGKWLLADMRPQTPSEPAEQTKAPVEQEGSVSKEAAIPAQLPRETAKAGSVPTPTPQQEPQPSGPSALATAGPAHAGSYKWLRTPQNCSIWAPATLNPEHILKIQSCTDNKANGNLVIKSDDGGSRNYYFYEGFFISSEKDCFADIQAYKPRLRARPDDPLPLVYIGGISSLSDNALISRFGAGTTIWVRVSSSHPEIMKDELCNKVSYRHPQGPSTSLFSVNAPLFSQVNSIYVLAQNTAGLDDIQEHVLKSLAMATAKLVASNKGYFSFTSGYHPSFPNVYVWDQSLSTAYTSSTLYAYGGDVQYENSTNLIQQARAAEQARRQEEEQRSKVTNKLDAFLQQSGASALVPLPDVKDNPFRYEGSVIATQAFYVEMLSRDLSHFQSRDGGFLVVSGLDPRHSMAQHADVLLAGTVTGVHQLSHGLTVPLLALKGIHVCQMKECQDIVPPSVPGQVCRGGIYEQNDGRPGTFDVTAGEIKGRRIMRIEFSGADGKTTPLLIDLTNNRATTITSGKRRDIRFRGDSQAGTTAMMEDALGTSGLKVINNNVHCSVSHVRVDLFELGETTTPPQPSHDLEATAPEQPLREAGAVVSGMTMEQVVSVRGAPTHKEVIPPDMELWHYPASEVAFQNGKVSYVKSQ